MKTIVCFIMLMLTLSGCSNGQLQFNYEKMQSSDDGINGYSIDLRIYGNYNNERINEIIKIKNYNNTKYEITKISRNKEASKDTNELKDGKSNRMLEKQKNEVIYVVNNKTYIMGEDGEYTLTNEDVKYNNPSIYLEGLNNVSKTIKISEEKNGDIRYKVYEVVYNKEFISKLVADTSVSNIEIKNDVTGKIYLTKEGYIARIIYNIEDITINANYYGIDKSSDIVLPSEITMEVHND